MPKDQSLPTVFSEAIRAELDAIVPRVAEHMRPVYGHEPVSKDERRRRFWQTAPGWTPEREYRLLTGQNPDGTPVIDQETGQPAKPLSRQAVGLLKYPHREIDAKAGGRADDLSAIAAYMREMAELGPPDPEPLEMLAQQQEEVEQDAGRTTPTRVAPAPVPVPDLPPAPVPPSPTVGMVPPLGGPAPLTPPMPDPLLGG